MPPKSSRAGSNSAPANSVATSPAPTITLSIDGPLLLASLLTGALDAGIYSTFSVFASMQTGNTIFLALGAAALPLSRPDAWFHSLTSISCFVIGILLCTVAFRWRPGPVKLSDVAGAFLVQAAFVFIAAGLVRAGVHELAPLAFASAQSGAQMAVARTLLVKEIPTTVLTSVYCDLTMGVVARHGETWGRGQWRRAGVIVVMLAGGIMGGWVVRTAGLETLLWVVGGGKALVALIFMSMSWR